ncbi:regulator of telomere elongation helicase 1-like isoform X2 [Hylaeus volcanicus]|uniref:regulator of telomere elongation helicase 1-like isoform X2 n=1 Tax=Hylaeus volcanicus TaxID=313075 RepID=UPI0023B792A2|nr:regulator of telomere elongation helicase 1-like isoform X2 [Hylaeus volcanicus]
MTQYGIDVNGIHVKFPYPLYDAQKLYIEKLVTALSKGKNALLESPTGTGKTLCLLCGALAWQNAVMQGIVPHPNQISKKIVIEPGLGCKGSSSQDVCPSHLVWDTLAGRHCMTIKELLVVLYISHFLDQSHDKQPQETILKTWTFNKPVYRKRPPHIQVETLQDKNINEQVPKIFFMSRTHSQLSQVISELKQTAYISHTVKVSDRLTDSQKSILSDANDLKATMLGSRDHLCIHSELTALKGAARTAACQQKLKVHSCHYEGGLSKIKSDFFTYPRDIEELRVLGAQKGFCPYYAARDHIVDCHIVFLPYEYVLNASMRKQLKFQLRGSVLIVDEGHHLERVAEEAGSFDLPVSTIKFCVSVLSEFIGSQFAVEQDIFSTQDVFDKLLKPFTQLCEYIESIELEPSTHHPVTAKSRVLEASHLFAAFQKCGIFPKDFAFYATIFSKCTEWVSMSEEAVSVLSHNLTTKQEPYENVFVTLSKALDHLLSCFSVTFFFFFLKKKSWLDVKCFQLIASVDQEMLPLYRMFVSESTYRTNTQRTNNSTCLQDRAPKFERTLCFWCFTAGAMVKDLLHCEGVHSLIVTSGTLSPLKSYAESLGINFVEQCAMLENLHVIPKENICVQIVTRHSSYEKPLRFVYQNKEDQQLFFALGDILCDLCSTVPGGILVFFSSYAQMTVGLQCLSNTNLWGTLVALREVISELSYSTPEAFQTILKRFRSTPLQTLGSKSSKKKILIFAVIRGRFSEGLNLINDMCRCVVIVGVPHPAITDPRLKLKRAVLDQTAPGKGLEWYLQQASRAVNQGIGRVIRHQNDFGLVLLVDERFASYDQYSQLSRWILESSPSFSPVLNYNEILGNINNFFKKFSTPMKTPFIKKEFPCVTKTNGLLHENKNQVIERPTFRRPKMMIRSPTKKASVLFDQQIKKATMPKKSSLGGASLSSVLRSTYALRQMMHTSFAIKTETEGEISHCGVCAEMTHKQNPLIKSLRCGHRACQSCWKTVLVTNLACPLCGEKTRKEHIYSGWSFE